MSKRVNRVLEVDVDTDRSNPVQVRLISHTSHRGKVPDETDPETDAFVLAQGLLAAILKIEDDGIMPKGAAMKRAVEVLQEGYVDADNQINTFEVDEDGNKILEDEKATK